MPAGADVPEDAGAAGAADPARRGATLAVHSMLGYGGLAKWDRKTDSIVWWDVPILRSRPYGITLDHPLPASVVELMLVAFKAHRASRVYKKDNYIDLAAYAEFAEESQQIENGTLTRASR